MIELAKEAIIELLKSREPVAVGTVIGTLSEIGFSGKIIETAIKQLGVQLVDKKGNKLKILKVVNGENIYATSYWYLPLSEPAAPLTDSEELALKINWGNTLDFLEQTIDETFTQPIYGKSGTFTNQESWEKYLKESNTGETISKPVYERTHELTDKQLKPLEKLYNSWGQEYTESSQEEIDDFSEYLKTKLRTPEENKHYIPLEDGKFRILNDKDFWEHINGKMDRKQLTLRQKKVV